MPGLVAHDFGDAIRSAANQVAEDSKEYDKVGPNMDIFRAFSEGFLSKVESILYKAELETLAISPFILTTEPLYRTRSPIPDRLPLWRQILQHRLSGSQSGENKKTNLPCQRHAEA